MLERRLLSNSFSILVTRLTQSITTFVMSAAIGRLLGAFELGQYLLAFSFYFVFMSLASEGLKVLFTRELSRHPEATPTYLVSGTILQLLFSAIAYSILVVLVVVLPYQPQTTWICLVMGLALFPFSLSNITESIFLAREKMYLITASTVPVYIGRVLIMIWAMQRGGDVLSVAAIFVGSEAVILLVEWAIIGRSLVPNWKLDRAFMRSAVQSVRTFIAIEGVSVVNSRLQMLILSVLGGEFVVGLYGAIIQLMQPFDILSNSLTVGVFPSMTKTVAMRLSRQRLLVERVIEALNFGAMPLIVGLILFGEDVLALVYQQDDFQAATVPLMIVSLGLLASCLNRPLSYLLVANQFERINMREVLVTTLVSAIAGVVLVSQFGLIGAAATVLLTRIVGCSQYVYAVCYRFFPVRYGRIVRRPLLLTAIMLGVFLVLKMSGLSIGGIIGVSFAVYGGLLAGLAWQARRSRQTIANLAR
ncbi:oligosaccharide flippase family protein [Leptolyngbya sp. AN02str]|uniref:oligosaccharide flippase family protein n=1 Tax=Leptolyngbya sp. AN02str TaxID=3423363 RepID=UPI003D318EFE